MTSRAAVGPSEQARNIVFPARELGLYYAASADGLTLTLSEPTLQRQSGNRILILVDRSTSMLDETLVVVLTDHGRTPKLNKAQGGGRDHWSQVYSLLFAGALADDTSGACTRTWARPSPTPSASPPA